MRFRDASAVSGGPGTWKGHNPDGWDIVGITNGGFLMAQAARAVAAEAEGRIPLSVTSHFLNPVGAGDVEIGVEVLKQGRNLSMMRALTHYQGRLSIQTTAVLESADRKRHDAQLLGRPRPQIPPPEDCLPAAPAQDAPFPPPFTGKVDLRIHPDDVAGVVGEKTGRPEIRGWFRLKDEEPLDSFAVLLAADAFPPPIFNADLPIGWTPTVDLSVQIRRANPSGWLQCEFVSRFVTDGLLEEDGEIWDESGKLVALSRQLALVPRG